MLLTENVSIDLSMSNRWKYIKSNIVHLYSGVKRFCLLSPYDSSFGRVLFFMSAEQKQNGKTCSHKGSGFADGHFYQLHITSFF